MTSRAYKKLTEIKEELFRYCHNETCRLIYENPADHKKCREKLGLDKSIAWRAALHLSEILHTKNLIILETCMPLIHELITVVAPCFIEFSKLYSLLSEANYWIRYLHQKMMQDSVDSFIKNAGGCSDAEEEGGQQNGN
ncbi:MAG: hypothetical protein DRO05_00540 [Thermoproteota archaeon]|nr:MAG: hypothetical protein DRO05_00540 [Candidatus Korarchaeota archaeon]